MQTSSTHKCEYLRVPPPSLTPPPKKKLFSAWQSSTDAFHNKFSKNRRKMNRRRTISSILSKTLCYSFLHLVLRVYLNLIPNMQCAKKDVRSKHVAIWILIYYLMRKFLPYLHLPPHWTWNLTATTTDAKMKNHRKRNWSKFTSTAISDFKTINNKRYPQKNL